MNIVYSSSDAYCLCTYISMLSLFENNKNNMLNVFVLSTDISTDNKKRILDLGKQYNVSITIIDAKDDFVAGSIEYNLELSRGAYNTYSRIMLNKWFYELDKIIVIDSDTLVVDDISPMWDIDLTDKLIAAVPEIGVYSKNSTIESQTLIDSLDLYFNMGIVVINLAEWRSKNIDEYLKRSVQKQVEKNLVADQSIINRYLNAFIIRMSLKYNFYSPMHGTSYKKIMKVFNYKEVFSREEIEEAQANPVIIHFYGHSFERPWFKHNASLYKKKYAFYRNLSIWKNDRLPKWKKSPNLVFKLYDFFCFVLLKMHLFDFCLEFRYIVGQKIKRKTNLHR